MIFWTVRGPPRIGAAFKRGLAIQSVAKENLGSHAGFLERHQTRLSAGMHAPL